MKIIVLNGSPKGEYSITFQYVKFLQKVYTAFDFQVLHISQKIKKIEKNEDYFNKIVEDVRNADVILWVFGLWVLAVPAQYMRFIELITERKAESAFKDKYTAAISTSIQFYDHTAHNYIRAVCEDLGMRFVDGISFYMLDLMKEEKRKDLLIFFDNLLRTQDQLLSTSRMFTPLHSNGFTYQASAVQDKISTSKKVLIITDQDKDDYYYDASIPFLEKFMAKRVANKIIAGFD